MGLKHKNWVLSNVRVTPDERLVLETSNLSVNLTHALWQRHGVKWNLLQTQL